MLRKTARGYLVAALNETFTYDAIAGGNGGKGRLTSSTDAAGSTAYVWDGAHGRMTGETRTIGTYAHATAYSYSPGGRLLQMTYPSGRIVIYGHDATGRVNYVGLKRTSTATEEPIVWWAGYYPFGELRGLTLANGLNMWSNRDWEYRWDGLFLTPAAGGASLVERQHWGGDGLNLLKLNNE